MNMHIPTKSITALASGSDPADLPQYVFAQLSNDTPTAERRNDNMSGSVCFLKVKNKS